MGHLQGKFLKWKMLIPVVAFVCGIILTYGAVSSENQDYQAQLRTKAELNARNYAERMVDEINAGVDITQTIEQVIISEGGSLNQFEKIAANLYTDNIQSIQIAPQGVVTEIYPEEGNEAGKIDLVNDEKRGEITRYGIENNMIIMQGPFNLNQGGKGIAIRNPVFLEGEDGENHFWGLTIVIIRVPDIFSNSIQALDDFGYAYCLEKTPSPLAKEYEEIYSSGEEMHLPVEYTFELGGCFWKLSVMPKGGWKESSQGAWIFVIGIIIDTLITVLITSLLFLTESRKKLKQPSATDALTGLLNRSGFDEEVDRYMKTHPHEYCVCIALDVDDFKFINDLYGHSCGDRVLQQLAESIRTSFPKNAILGRNGGDEFCIILKNCTCTEVEKEIEAFTQMPRKFRQGGVEYKFSISLGYAEAPVLAANRFGLFRNADAALYEVKLRGKHGCLAYNSDLHLDKRTQLGFALNDISDYLPEAFLIYKADRDNDQILFSSGEMIRFAGCTDMDDFLEYTKRSFRSLISETERELVENTVWQQVASKEQGALSYVGFNFQGKDGVIRPVVACGRVVENQYYGKVFYVVISDRFGR